jgi:DNA-binding PucR family transcriptional regulator
VVLPGDADWDGLARALGTRIGPLRIGIGGSCDSGATLDRPLRDADLALRVGAAIGNGAVVRFDDLGVYRLLAVDGDPAELHRFVEESLGPVLAYDREHGSQLVRTVATYLESGCSLERASRDLIIHRSTLKYRLARAGELLGKDLSHPDVRFNVQLAARTLATLDALNGVGAAAGITA